MRLNIVNPYNSVAMARMSQPLKQLSKLYEVTETQALDPAADCNIHFPFHTLADAELELGEGKHIAVYTHCNPGSEVELFRACERADIVTTMTFKGRKELLNLGVDPSKIWTVYNPADSFTFKKRLVLIVGYPQPNGRKRESLLLDLAWKYNLDAYEFVLLGTQWEQLAAQLLALGVSVRYAHADRPDLIRAFYQQADVFIATGYMEGGPLPLLEAMSSGCRVLSPRFGYAFDLLDDEDIYDTPDELMDKLNAMFEHNVFYHQLARAWSTEDYINEYALLVGRLFNSTTEAYPARGMDRYTQLLDIIDREKPLTICEIGTWNGNNALRMIQTAAKYYPMEDIRYQGFDLFDDMTGEQFVRELSKQAQPREVVQRRLDATGAKIDLVIGDTKKTVDYMDVAEFIFVDGGHSEATIQNDGLAALEMGKTVVFDDYYHSGKPDGMGCNKFIDGLSNDYEITHLPVHTTADDGREIGMVLVKHADLSLQVPTVTYTTDYALNN
jgi:hypothetical protein